MATHTIEYIPPMTGAASFKQHYYYLTRAADSFDISAVLDLSTSVIQLHCPRGIDTLFPQFSRTDAEGSLFYSALFKKISDRFAGWRPYPSINIDLFKDKLAFKKRLVDERFLTPRFSEFANADLVNVIIKRRCSAFSQGIKGPFLSTDNHPLQPELGEYYEQFIPGDIVKIWYMNEKSICMELASMPYVVGDGQRPIGDLLIALSDSKGYENPEDALLKQVIAEEKCFENDPRYREALSTLNNIRQVLAFYGLTIDDVLDADQRQIIEFRYVHRFPRNNATHWLDRCEWDINPYRDQLYYLGKLMSAALLEESCDLLFYTVDAILDDKKQLWVLEANSNPMMHPFIYEDMVGYLSKHYIASTL